MKILTPHLINYFTTIQVAGSLASLVHINSSAASTLSTAGLRLRPEYRGKRTHALSHLLSETGLQCVRVSNDWAQRIIIPDDDLLWPWNSTLINEHPTGFTFVFEFHPVRDFTDSRRLAMVNAIIYPPFVLYLSVVRRENEGHGSLLTERFWYSDSLN